MDHLWISTHDERGRRRPRASEDIPSAQGQVVDQWREEQAQIRVRIEQNEKADQNYIEQGIRLLKVVRNAQELFRARGRAERAALLRFIIPDSTLKDDRVLPAFKPPFDIINRIAQETQKAAPDPEAACPVLLPWLDELRTYCYEHKIEEIPALLAV